MLKCSACWIIYYSLKPFLDFSKSIIHKFSAVSRIFFHLAGFSFFSHAFSSQNVNNWVQHSVLQSVSLCWLLKHSGKQMWCQTCGLRGVSTVQKRQKLFNLHFGLITLEVKILWCFYTCSYLKQNKEVKLAKFYAAPYNQIVSVFCFLVPFKAVLAVVRWKSFLNSRFLIFEAHKSQSGFKSWRRI